MKAFIKLITVGGADVIVATQHITRVVGVPRSARAAFDAVVHSVDGKAIEVAQTPERIRTLMEDSDS